MPLTPKGYTTKAEVQDFLHFDIDASYDPALDDLIAKAEARVEHACRRTFDQEVGAVRYVTSRGGDTLHIPDFTTITTVTVDPYHTAAYLLGPENWDWIAEPLDEERPFNRLVLINGGTFPTVGTVQIEGTAGWGSVPSMVRHATTVLVADVTRLWRDQHNDGSVASVSLGDFSVDYAAGRMNATAATPEWRQWLRPYVRTRSVR